MKTSHDIPPTDALVHGQPAAEPEPVEAEAAPKPKEYLNSAGQKVLLYPNGERILAMPRASTRLFIQWLDRQQPRVADGMDDSILD